MSDLPQITGDRLRRALGRAGFVELRQVGSHLAMRHHEDATRRATIPMHGAKPIKPGTLRAILRGAGLSIEELRELI